jgi:PleD family two-component response regulator
MNGSKKKSVLIIDDDKTNIIALSHILGTDYKIHAVVDSADAVDAAELYIPDVILLDVVMPDPDGLEVIAALKKSDKTRDIPVIFTTGLEESEIVDTGISLGAAGFIAKPFDAADVRRKVEGVGN